MTAATMKRSGILQWLIWGHVVMVLIGVGVMYLFAKRDSARVAQVIPAYTQVPDLPMIDQHGRALSLRDLEGKVWIGNLVYTDCPGPCPVVSSRVARLLPEVTKHADLRLVSISVDPTVDTPEKLREYAARFGASDSWLFLAGDQGQTDNLAATTFDVPVQRNSEAKDPILHTTKLIVVDRAGYVRGYYESLEDLGLNDALRDARRLLSQ